MKDDRNFKWTKKDIANQYKKENPNWSWNKCWSKAKIIYKELNKLNREMWNDNKNYYKIFKPFSFYESEDGTWSSIPELDDI